MSASGKTQHYNLPYFTPDDLTTWGAFNNSMLMLDNILYTLSQSSGETPELGEIKDEIKNINDTIEELRTNINYSLVNLQNSITTIQTSIEKIKNDVSKINADVSTNTNNISILQTNYNTVDEQVQNHGLSIYQIEKNIEDLETNYSVIKGNIDNLKKSYTYELNITSAVLYTSVGSKTTTLNVINNYAGVMQLINTSGFLLNARDLGFIGGIVFQIDGDSFSATSKTDYVIKIQGSNRGIANKYTHIIIALSNTSNPLNKPKSIKPGILTYNQSTETYEIYFFIDSDDGIINKIAVLFN